MRRHAVGAFVVLVALGLMVPVSAGIGRRAWVDVRHAQGSQEALAVTTSSGGGRIFVAGGGNWPVTVIAYRYDGSVAWRSGFAPPSPYEPVYIEGIALSSDGREVIVIAPLIGPDDDPMAVAAFDTSTGVLDWSWQSTPVSAYPIDLATGPGIVAVVGHAGHRDSDWFVVALRPDDGTPMWTVRSDAPAGHAAAGSAAVRDGRVLVSGYVDTRTGSAARTVAYAAIDGAIEWHDTFRGASYGTIAGVRRDGTVVLVEGGWTVIEYDTDVGHSNTCRSPRRRMARPGPRRHRQSPWEQDLLHREYGEAWFDRREHGDRRIQRRKRTQALVVPVRRWRLRRRDRRRVGIVRPTSGCRDGRVGDRRGVWMADDRVRSPNWKATVDRPVPGATPPTRLPEGAGRCAGRNQGVRGRLHNEDARRRLRDRRVPNHVRSFVDARSSRPCVGQTPIRRGSPSAGRCFAR